MEVMGSTNWQEFANVFQIFQEGLAKFPSPGQIIGPKRQEWMSWQWKCWRIPKVVKVTILQRKLSSIYIFSNHLWKRSANSAHDSCAKSIYKNLLEYMWYKDDTKDFMDLIFYYSPRLSWNLGVNIGKLPSFVLKVLTNFLKFRYGIAIATRNSEEITQFYFIRWRPWISPIYYQSRDIDNFWTPKISEKRLFCLIFSFFANNSRMKGPTPVFCHIWTFHMP